MPIFNELFRSIVIYILGFFPRMLVVIPLSLLWFSFAFLIYVRVIRLFDLSKYGSEEINYQIKTGRKLQKYGLFSKK